ncbi:hypothetical protein, partial [Citrobacter portucalensis]|uniref:hypothetical protein n=1 Tax=Citrobacter portucalensis TaxID=1639133 RepID=UPI00226B1FEA
LMVKSLSVMGITDSDFPMSSIIGRANLLLTTSIGGGVWMRIKMALKKSSTPYDFMPLRTLPDGGVNTLSGLHQSNVTQSLS